jgi:type I restriction enzyme, S subunit
MGRRYQAYPEYKGSGVEWLDDLPSHWEVKRLGSFFEERRNKVSDKDYSALSVTMQGIVPQLENAAKTDAGDNRKLVLKNDFVINSRSDRKGSSGISPLDGSVSLISIVMIPKNINPRFVHHILRSYPFQQEFYRYGKGIVADLWSTNSSEMKNILLPSIPTFEQIQIANFLDHETRKIGTLIEKQQQLIQLLKEKRQAVISHAVTKGLNPDAPMKDTGVEWLGEVPRHWVISRIKNVVNKIVDGPHFSPKYLDKGYMFISARNIKTDCWSLADAKYISEDDFNEFNKRVRPEIGDVLLTKGGTTGVARTVDLDFPFQVWVHVAVLKTDQTKMDPFYFAYVLNGTTCYEQSQLYTFGATNNDLGLSRIAKIFFARPPMDEQRIIHFWLDHECKKFDNLISKGNESIELMQERRTALISAAVTGKIDVRNWHPPQQNNHKETAA